MMVPHESTAPAVGRPRLLYVVSEDWYFLSHRLPMARAAAAAGFDVHVATHVVEGGAAIAREGFTVHPIPFRRGKVAPWANLQTIRALRGVHRQVAPDLIHRVALQPTVLDGIAGLGRRVVTVNAVTGLGYSFVSASIKARVLRTTIAVLLRLLVGTRSAVLVQNPDDAALLAQTGIPRERIALVPGSGVDVDVLKPLPDPDGRVTVAFAGRLIESKGIRTLVAAHRLLRDRDIPVDLLIAGDRDEANPASTTASEVAAWSREPGVQCLGHIDDIVTLWRRAHIAVLPSRGGEGIPKALLEAAACGRAMIATDVPGCREIVVSGLSGLLVPPDNPVALADAIERLAAARELRLQFAAQARNLAIERFSTDIVCRGVTDLYKKLLSQSSRTTPGHPLTP
jgi:glycosyltransferase involved in cell wall biosynthesis